VQAHEGRISVQSAPGMGTKFTLELKRAAVQAGATGTDLAAVAVSGGTRG
jgi:hypothetical protein